jgi:SAM-dependent methyltransferase
VASPLGEPIGHAWLSSFATSPMLRRRRERFLAKADGEVLDLTARRALSDLAAAPDHSLDTVLSVFALCTVADLGAVLASVRRVLRPEGRFLFLEHVPDWPGSRRPSDVLAPTWRWVAGCDPGRDIPEEVRRAGFVLMDLERFTVPTLAVPLRSCVAGVAVLPEGAPRPGSTPRSNGFDRE